ncbi:unnamed protein product [Brugia timori]|uniref:Ovule protein n=1 Tax=Brugia timori TaxID=42155 RepID=A0A0R3QV81_9BILA|nr:unnamed protein product [Brugia timori]
MLIECQYQYAKMCGMNEWCRNDFVLTSLDHVHWSRNVHISFVHHSMLLVIWSIMGFL